MFYNFSSSKIHTICLSTISVKPFNTAIKSATPTFRYYNVHKMSQFFSPQCNLKLDYNTKDCFSSLKDGLFSLRTTAVKVINHVKFQGPSQNACITSGKAVEIAADKVINKLLHISLWLQRICYLLASS